MSIKKRRNLISFVFMILGFASGVKSVFPQNAIDFALKDLDGQTTRLKDYIGRNVILVEFWATWCVPCIKELPHLQRFHSQYSEKGLKVIAITVDSPETVAKVMPFMSRYKYTFTVLLDTESKVIALYNPSVILPYTVLIDRQGRIRYAHQGYSPGDEKRMEEELFKLLQEEKVTEARKISLSLFEAFLNRIFSDDEYVETVRNGRVGQIINRVDTSLSTGNLIFGIRADANVDFSPWEGEFSLAKRFFEYNGKKWSMRLGDFYYSVGRGLLLTVLKTFEKEGLEFIIDTTLDGGKLSYNRNQFSAELYGGWIDREFTDQKDKVYGGILGWKVKNFMDFKLNLMGAQLEKGTILGDKNVTMESFSLDIPSIRKKAKFYGEFVLLQKNKYYEDKRIYGHGIYLESGLFLGDFTVLFEFKDYLHLNFDYNRPPMLESDNVPIIANQFAKEALDITGFAGRIDYYVAQIDTLVWGKMAFFWDNPQNRLRDIVHIYGGVEKKFKETGWFNILFGYRQEDTESLVYFYTHGRTLHGQCNLSYPLATRFSLEADIQAKDFKGEHLDYYEVRSFLSFHYSQRWILTLMYDQTTDPQVLFFKAKKNWLGAQLEIKLSQANSIRIFYGAMKGGVKCSGGLCKFFPPFDGFRMDILLRF